MTNETHDVVIVGGGTAGISVAARLLRIKGGPRVTLIEPAETHYYQPLWTLIGAGIFPLEESARAMADVMPSRATWIRDSVASFDPDRDSLTLASGKTLTYAQLVVAAGIQLDWDRIEGLPETLGKNGVTSNYAVETVPYTHELISSFRGGRALFTFPSTPIKCAGAAQKIMWLAEEAFRRRGVRDASTLTFASAGAAIFGIPRYRAPLEELVEERGIETVFKNDLVALRPASKEAVFRHVDTGEEKVIDYEMIHVTPPQSAPDFIKRSPLSDGTPLGYVEVHKHTLQHARYPNVFSLGDASSLPCSKTGAAVRKQAPVLVENLLAFREGRSFTGSYDGYSSCPVVTGYHKVILAEFGYDGVIMETFPFNQAKERYSMYLLKAYALPRIYWYGMLRGLM
jgi:sulfide:quinone oxidoreductase